MTVERASHFLLHHLLCRGSAICLRGFRHRRVHLGPSICDAFHQRPRGCAYRPHYVFIQPARLVRHRKGCEAYRTLSAPNMTVRSHRKNAVKHLGYLALVGNTRARQLGLYTTSWCLVRTPRVHCQAADGAYAFFAVYRYTLTCSSSHVQSLSCSFASKANWLGRDTRAQGLRYYDVQNKTDARNHVNDCRHITLTFPLHPAPSGAAPAYRELIAPYSTGYQ